MRDEGDGFIREVSEALRAPVTLGADFDARVMAAVREAAAEERAAAPALRANGPAGGGRLGWLVRRRTVRLSPLTGLATAAGIAALAVVAAGRVRGPAERAAIAAGTGATGSAESAPGVTLVARRTVRFTLDAPAAASVSVVGDFNDWDAAAAPLARGADGRWTAALPLTGGRYEYAFVVDGRRFVADPAAPAAPADDFGAGNSVLQVDAGTP